MQITIDGHKITTPCAISGNPIDVGWFGRQLIWLAEHHQSSLTSFVGAQIATNEEREAEDRRRTQEYEDDVLKRAAEIQARRGAGNG